MDRHDDLRARGDLFLDARHVDVVVGEVDVDEHRPRPEAVDDTGGGEERIGRNDDVVAGADAEDHQRYEQRIRTGGQRDSVARLAVLGKVAFEVIDALPQDEVLRFVNLLGDAEYWSFRSSSGIGMAARV